MRGITSSTRCLQTNLTQEITRGTAALGAACWTRSEAANICNHVKGNFASLGTMNRDDHVPLVRTAANVQHCRCVFFAQVMPKSTSLMQKHRRDKGRSTQCRTSKMQGLHVRRSSSLKRSQIRRCSCRSRRETRTTIVGFSRTVHVLQFGGRSTRTGNGVKVPVQSLESVRLHPVTGSD